MFQRDNLPNHPIDTEKLAQEDVVRVVAEDVADGEDGLAGCCLRGGGEGAVDGEAVGEGEGEGFFAEDVQVFEMC